MSLDIVDRFLKDQVDLAAQLSVELKIAPRVVEGPAHLDIARRKHLGGEAPHALLQIAEVVLVRLDGPDRVADGVHQLAREAADPLQRRAGLAAGGAPLDRKST